MKLEQVTFGPGPAKPPDKTSLTGPGRMPRWTRQEIVVLIEGKRIAESRVGPGQSKWGTVSGYCKMHGVDRGPVQCRKRWSNLAGDHKRIKEWEKQQGSETLSDSFWVMRNDLRREKRLPGFFDKEVYDILEGLRTTTASVYHAPTTLISALGRCSKEVDDLAEEEAVFLDSGRSVAAEDGLFSDSEEGEAVCIRSSLKEHTLPTTNIPSPTPISVQQSQPSTKGLSSEGRTNGKQNGFNPEMGDTSQERRKRKRSQVHGDDEDTNALQNQLISVVEKNGQMLNAHLESQNTNSQLDRDQRKVLVDSLVSVLGKLADAFGKIADKL